MDCGPTCIQMIARYYGRHQNITLLREVANYGKDGVSLLGISEASEKIGFRTKAIKVKVSDLLEKAPLPCILHWNQNHFVVLLPQSGKKSNKIVIADPAKGIITYSKKEFVRRSQVGECNFDELELPALLMEPTIEFYNQEKIRNKKLDIGRICHYLVKSRWKISQVFLALFIASIVQIAAPFLTQSIVDVGINRHDLKFLTIVLAGQIILVFSRTVIEFMRARLIMNISVNLSFALVSDFWIKITRLPISYFNTIHTGDTFQRLNDSKKVEVFLTGNAINTFFSLLNFVVFSFILTWYSLNVFFIFLIASIIYFLWIRLFLSVRRKINYQTFSLAASENNISIQLVQGIKELKLNNAEHLKRWEWERVQAALYKVQFKILSYNQLQQTGGILINEGKNIAITFIVAQMVLKGQLTFGAMLAVQYIIGQLNSPIEQFAGFIQSAQDAKISLERVNEIHQLTEEEYQFSKDGGVKNLPNEKSIRVDNVSFAYPGAGNKNVVENITFKIPGNKITAIVGTSGSGKTTILNLLLKYYEKYDGEIAIGNTCEAESQLLKRLSPSFWRSHCGAVLQDGFIFDDTIAKNIAVGFEEVDFVRLVSACEVANILSFIESLPNGFNTILGANGVSISQGQKQRLLIARVVYKNPDYIFFDEATNALDANTEKVIVENLHKYFVGKTVVIVAHRLSTVKNADKIVVLQEGKIVEEGTHAELTKLNGKYVELIRNQLELGG